MMSTPTLGSGRKVAASDPGVFPVLRVIEHCPPGGGSETAMMRCNKLRCRVLQPTAARHRGAVAERTSSEEENQGRRAPRGARRLRQAVARDGSVSAAYFCMQVSTVSLVHSSSPVNTGSSTVFPSIRSIITEGAL